MKCVAPGAELNVEQHQDDGEADGNDEREAALLLFEAVKLAGPGVFVTGGELDLVGQASLQIAGWRWRGRGRER